MEKAIHTNNNEHAVARMIWCKIWLHMANEMDKMPQKEGENLNIIVQSMRKIMQEMMEEDQITIETKEKAMHIKKACQWVQSGIMLMEKMLPTTEHMLQAHLHRSKQETKQLEKILEIYTNPIALTHSHKGIKVSSL